MRRFLTAFALMLLTAFTLSAILTPQAARAQDSQQAQIVADLDPTFAVEWMQAVYDGVQAAALNPPNSARVYAYAGVTMYEALYPGMPLNRSFVGQLNGLRDLPYPDEADIYDWQVVTATAMQTVLNKLFEGKDQTILDSFVELRDTHVEARRADMGDDVITDSVAFGEEFAAGVLEWISDDNYEDTRADSQVYTLLTGAESFWQLTTEGSRAIEPLWGQIRPFVMDYADECNVEMNYEFSTEENSAFYQQAMEVYEIGNDLTEEQRDTVEFWIDTPGLTGAPAGHWMMIGSQLVEQLDLDLERTAEMYAMLGVTLADSFISCWSLKYQVNLLRPVTYIQEYISPRWTPFVESPPFPEYPSGHSVSSAAAADTLTQLFGQVAFTDSTHVGRGFAPRTYFSFEQAATEAAISRIYGGIHFRAGVENGTRQGRCVSERVFDRIVLNPVRQGE